MNGVDIIILLGKWFGYKKNVNELQMSDWITY